MTPEIKVGPPELTLHQGYAILVSGPDGQIPPNEQKGLFFLDTRLISDWSIAADGVAFKLLNGGVMAPNAARVYFTNAEIKSLKGKIADSTLQLVLGRHIDGGVHEDLELVNHASETAEFNLEISIRNDFADIFEVKARNVTRRGEIQVAWSSEDETLTTTYRNKGFSRAVRIRAVDGSTPMTYANGRLSFKVKLAPGASWRACLLYDLADGDDWLPAPKPCTLQYMRTDAVRRREKWQSEVLKIDSSNRTFAATYAQAVNDMGALRLPIDGTDHIRFVPAAGLPWFVALFGRDSLVISLQSSIVHPEFALGALRVLAKWQATTRNDYHDASPGKIHHELRRGELAFFDLIPHTPYYGTADATALYLITLHSVWQSTGDMEVLKTHLGTAERCLEWIDQYGDLDGDGFQEYERRSSAGLDNQSWKDSGEAVVNPDGSMVKAPKALCELQGYVYDAWLRMAQVYDALERPEKALSLRRKAKALFRHFNEVFWSDTEGYYAYALDGDKKPSFSVASNPGQCLWSGIVPPDRAKKVAERLMRADMWSGWGIRTLSADHKSFNPFKYQVGAVWPHDNGFIAQGFKRYGFHEETCKVAEAIIQAANYFDSDQLPELYAGTQKDASNFPVQYLGANVPQGWAAGSIFALLQAMLGLQADAPNDRLYVDPALPEWLPDLVVRDLRIGKMVFDITFTRKASGRTDFKVTKGPKGAVVRRSMVAWSRQLAAKRRVPKTKAKTGS
jgi:glycogen debranching enzyme